MSIDTRSRVRREIRGVVPGIENVAVTPYLYVLPVVVLYAVLMLYPVAQAFWLSFHKFTSISGANQFVGLENYQAVLSDPLFWHSLTNTVVFSIGLVFVPLVLGLGLAVLLDMGFNRTTTLRTLIFVPVVVPIVVAGILFTWLFSQGGFLNSVLVTLGLVEQPIPFLGQSRFALPSVMTMAVWKRTGYYMVILLAGLQSIPESVYEAARIQGKSRWKTFRHITLPLLKPALLIVVVIGLIDSIKLFAHVFVMTEGGPGNASEILSTYFYEVSFQYFQFGKGSAIGFIMFFMSLILAMIVIKLSGD
jgi:ABC-type sugar transport system permease subunit